MVMELTSAAVAVALLLAAQLSAAAALVPAPIGQPNCSTTCGGVSVTYPFGFGPAHCYWPGFNLTCETSSPGRPRLLLGDGTLRVVDISLDNHTVRVMRTGSIVNTTGDFTSKGWSASFGGGFTEYGYKLSSRNDLVVYGCNVLATLLGDVGERTPRIVGSCSTSCTNFDGDQGFTMARGDGVDLRTSNKGKQCTRTSRCCRAPLNMGNTPNRVQVRWIYSGNHTVEQEETTVNVFIAEEGWVDQTGVMSADELKEVPLVLYWSVKLGPPQLQECPRDVSRMLCKSEHSICSPFSEGYGCYCEEGYIGNPYIAGGCRDIDECKNPAVRNACFGDCNNFPGSYECRCPRGRHGNASQPNGCDRSVTGLTVGTTVGSVAGSILLVLIVIFMSQRIKYMRATKLKQKHFKQNRGQLLQQLVSQNADITERMIIPVDELAKATNNFDRARELGGGGHGTVYKGILSDLHVVAIKKPKRAVQEEIDEFINEVAILSQINHRNIVKLFGCCLETKVPLLVYEFISNGTLYHHLHVEGPKSLSWGIRLRIATEISKAIAYLHSSVSIPIIHRDIKSSNILLDDTLTSKVSDFGASRYIPRDRTGLTTRVQGTIGYLDPMYFHTGRLNQKSDVYSFGVILVELLTRKKPFPYLSSDGDGLVMHFTNSLAEGNLAQILDPQVTEEGGQEVEEVATLAASCIKLSGDDRPTMRQVEITLEGFQASNVRGSIVMNLPSTEERQSLEESTRRYSMEQELLISARYPR